MTASGHDDEVEAYQHPWLGVEARHLATLAAVARTGSFRQAATELGYVQSAVSQQIARLEHVVGTRLVERQRGRRTTLLTRAGELLAKRGEGILGELHAARIDLARASETVRRSVQLAISSGAAHLLVRLLSAVDEELPAISIRVQEVVDEAELVPMLEHGVVDVAIGVSVSAPGVACVTLSHDPFVVLVTPDSPLAGIPCVSTAAQVADEQLIVPTASLSHGRLHAPNLPLDRALQVPIASAVPQLVAEGHGVGLLPRSVLDDVDHGLVHLPTVGLIAPQSLMLGWQAARRRTWRLEAFRAAAVRAFLEDQTLDTARAA